MLNLRATNSFFVTKVHGGEVTGDIPEHCATRSFISPMSCSLLPEVFAEVLETFRWSGRDAESTPSVATIEVPQVITDGVVTFSKLHVAVLLLMMHSNCKQDV